MLLQFVNVFVASSIENSSVFLSAYVDAAFSFFWNNIKYFSLPRDINQTWNVSLNLHQPAAYPIGLLAYQLFQTHLLSLTYYLLTKPLKRRLTGSGIHPIAYFSLHLKQKQKPKKTPKNRVLSNEFLLTLTKFYKINLLYRVLLFSFSIKIIHHTFPTYNFLFFSL